MKKILKNKRGTILVENVIFIVLNLVFLSILVLFLYSNMGDAAILEEQHAKKIALAIDAAKPGMVLSFNLGELIEKAKKENYSGKIVSIDRNIVTVRLRDKGGYSYSFFNDVDFDFLYYPHSVEDGEFFKIEVREK